MFAALYKIIIYPIYQLIELIYYLLNSISNNTVFSILGISVSITLLCLPLYNIAEKWQAEERNIQKKLKCGIDRIKKAFSGDEQYMILSTYYRQNHYHPIFALRSSFGLLIQIPFFIAAYSFLSHNQDLQGQTFLLIKDLAKPDNLITIGSFSINVLPVLMTLINIISGAIYTKGFSLKDKLQLYVMALFFLVFLYNSPSGLVFYWTMNNVFSLIKNLFYKAKNPKKTFFYFCCVVIFLLQIFLLKNIITKFTITHSIPKYRAFILLVTVAFYFLPLISKLINKCTIYIYRIKLQKQLLIFLFSCISITLLSVITIQNAVSTSVSEFSFIGNINNPTEIVKHSFWVCFGFCFFWPTCIYFLFSDKCKKVMTLGAFAILLIETVNVFFFSNKLGTMSNIFVVSNIQGMFSKMSIINFICLIGILSLVILCIKFFKRMILSLSVIFFFSFTILSIFNHSKINKVFTEYSKSYVAPQYEQEISPIFNFSKDGKNVVLVFIDSAAASLVNKIFTEKQELYSQFDGFTFFDNVASFGMHTVYCGPSIFGGYEYSPFELNKRTTETIKEKHQEATKVLPKLLIENDFNVTFINPNDSTWIENLNMKQCCNDEEKIQVYETISLYNKNFFEQMNFDNLDTNIQEKYIIRNAPLYALLCKSPTFLHNILIKEDYWSNAGLITSYIDFVSHYSSLFYLPQLTDYTAKENQALLMINLTPHTPYSILPPNYEVLPAKNQIDIEQQYYSANILSYSALGNWFESLKENNVYDNTKIIVVSDHGIRDTSDYNMQIEAIHPVLFIKEFNSHGKLKIDSTFCTIADVPFFTLKGISRKNTLINPYTKKEMLQNKNEGILVTTSHDFVARDDSNDKTFEIKDEHLFIIKDKYNNYTKYKDKS